MYIVSVKAVESGNDVVNPFVCADDDCCAVCQAYATDEQVVIFKAVSMFDPHDN